MLIRAGVADEFRSLMGQVQDGAGKGLKALTDGVANLPDSERSEALHDLLPAFGSQYADTASEVSTVFFESLMELQEVKRPVAPEILPELDSKIWHSLVGFATSPATLEQGGVALMYSILSGGLSRALSRASADTMIGNAQIQSVEMRSQRVPASGCCAFCALLASRFGEYRSSRSAGQVVGRGVAVGTGRGRGSKGIGRGIKTRGSQALGEKFHDHCRCSIVVVTEENEVELRTLAEGYYDSYREAADRVNDGLTLRVTDVSSSERLKNKYEWVDSTGTARNANERTKDILSAMRLDLGVS